MIPDKNDVADLVQEVFILLYQNMGKGTVIEFPRSWLYRVSINKCHDFLKKKQTHEKIDKANRLADENSTIELKEQQETIRKAMLRLKDNERVLAILYSEGLSYKEMAEITGIRFTSVGKTLTRTLAKLGDELKKMEYEMH
jgi:RNA polymerase sigma-70 factor, ECF subfamily